MNVQTGYSKQNESKDVNVNLWKNAIPITSSLTIVGQNATIGFFFS